MIQCSDYLPQTVTLTIPAGETSVDFSVDVVNDTLAGEGIETFLGVIESVSPEDVGVTQRTSQVSILDDDGMYISVYLLHSQYTIPLVVTVATTTSLLSLSSMVHSCHSEFHRACI